jgi:thioredoxin reductase (NADPH)
MADEVLDCIVVGGGAAGLVAALYLGRYKRSALVVDAGGSRLQRIPRSRNVPGFPDGIVGQELWDRMKQQAALYGVPTEQAQVERIDRSPDGVFTVHAEDGRRWRARFVILATGAADVEPELAGLPEGLQAGHVRYCPVCDGYETQGQRVAVLGRGVHGLREAMFVAGFGNQVTWLSMHTEDEVGTPELAALRERGIRVADKSPRHMRCVPGQGVQVELQDGSVLDFDVIYPALGLNHASALAKRLGAQAAENGQLEVDSHMQTGVDGLYAAGDVAVDLNQISVAAGHAAIAATAIHNRL